MLGLIGWIGRIILILLIIRMIVSFFTGARKRTGAPGTGGAGRTGRTNGTEKLGAKLVRDPQCGTYVAETTAIAARHGSETLHFCSEKCRDEYVSTPRATAV
jgi:YHS domain-containing protein